MKTHSGAESAVRELQKSGFDMKKLSVVGKDYHTDEQVVGYYNAGDRMRYWGKAGAFPLLFQTALREMHAEIREAVSKLIKLSDLRHRVAANAADTFV